MSVLELVVIYIVRGEEKGKGRGRKKGKEREREGVHGRHNAWLAASHDRFKAWLFPQTFMACGLHG